MLIVSLVEELEHSHYKATDFFHLWKIYLNALAPPESNANRERVF